MRRLILTIILCLAPTIAYAEEPYDCARKDGQTNLHKLDESIGSSMHGHMAYATCIAAALAVENYANASYIARTKLGVSTKGGQRSKYFGFREPSQELWEKGFVFRQQASRFAFSAQAASQVPDTVNRERTIQEYLQLLTLCQDCHRTHASTGQ